MLPRTFLCLPMRLPVRSKTRQVLKRLPWASLSGIDLSK